MPVISKEEVSRAFNVFIEDLKYGIIAIERFIFTRNIGGPPTTPANKENIENRINFFIKQGLDLTRGGGWNTPLHHAIHCFEGKREREDVLLFLCDKIKEAAKENPEILRSSIRSNEFSNAIRCGFINVAEKLIDIGVISQKDWVLQNYAGISRQNAKWVINAIAKSQQNIEYSVDGVPQEYGEPIDVSALVNLEKCPLLILIKSINHPCCLKFSLRELERQSSRPLNFKMLYKAIMENKKIKITTDDNTERMSDFARAMILSSNYAVIKGKREFFQLPVREREGVSIADYGEASDLKTLLMDRRMRSKDGKLNSSYRLGTAYSFLGDSEKDEMAWQALLMRNDELKKIVDKADMEMSDSYSVTSLEEAQLRRYFSEIERDAEKKFTCPLEELIRGIDYPCNLRASELTRSYVFDDYNFEMLYKAIMENGKVKIIDDCSVGDLESIGFFAAAILLSSNYAVTRENRDFFRLDSSPTSGEGVSDLRTLFLNGGSENEEALKIFLMRHDRLRKMVFEAEIERLKGVVEDSRIEILKDDIEKAEAARRVPSARMPAGTSGGSSGGSGPGASPSYPDYSAYDLSRLGLGK